MQLQHISVWLCNIHSLIRFFWYPSHKSCVTFSTLKARLNQIYNCVNSTFGSACFVRPSRKCSRSPHTLLGKYPIRTEFRIKGVRRVASNHRQTVIVSWFCSVRFPRAFSITALLMLITSLYNRNTS